MENAKENYEEYLKEYEKSRIAKYQTGKGLIEALDNIDFNGKIQFKALDYSKGKGDKTVTAIANVDYDILFLIGNKIMNQISFGRLDANKNKYLLYENKILSHTVDKNGMSPVNVLSIIRNNPEVMKIPYKIVIENGTGKAQRTETNGIMCAKGSYKRVKAVQIFLSEIEMERFMAKIYLRILAKTIIKEIKE